MRRVSIVGPTASGKSDVAMAVARRLEDVELISVDSMQVYRGMDIGTAKPTPAEREEVPHHCIDLVGHDEDFTVADFVVAHERALTEIDGRHGRAVLVGGTGLYHRVVVDEFDLPGEFPDVRAELEDEQRTQVLYDRLSALDPPAAAKMEPTNRRRIVRALEVTVGSGRPFSGFGPGLDRYPPTEVTQIGVRRPRDQLAQRIERRVHRMIEVGLVAEVERLHEIGFSRTAGQALGYKEIVACLEGRISEDEAIDLIISRTRRFATRQERWFRRDPRVRWIDVETDADVLSTVVPAVIDALRPA